MARIVRRSAAQNFLSAGGKLQFPLDFLPLVHRIEAVFIEASISSLDVPAAGVTSEQLTRLLDLVECERRLRISGVGMSAGDWLVHGKDVTRPAALAVGNGQAVELFWPIAFRDPRSVDPMDGAVRTEFYRGRTLDVYLSRPSDLLAGLAVNAGSVELVVYLSDARENDTGQSIVTGFVEVIGKEVRMPRGRYVDVYLVKNDGETVTEAELGNMQLTVDGRTNILERARTRNVARAFNYFTAKGGQVQGATDGVEGESLPTDGALPFVPLLTQVAPFKVTKTPDVTDALVFTFDGTLAANAARVFYRYVEEQDEVQSAKAADRLGLELTPESGLYGKTASKAPFPDTAPFRKTHGLLPRSFKNYRRK